MKLTCNLCSKNTHHELLTIDKPDRFEEYMGVDVKNYERIWSECEHCGVAVNNMNSNSLEAIRKIGTGYSEADNLHTVEQIEQRYNKIISLSPNNSDNVHRVKRVLNFFRDWYTKSKEIHLIDIGSGTGVFLSELHNKADEYTLHSTALDTDPLMAKHLKSLNQFKVVEDLFPYKNMRNNFDFIALNKVLEHIEKPHSLLNTISDHLNKDRGLFYLEVPCITNVWLKPKDDNSLGSIHFNLYSLYGLNKLLKEADLMVLENKRIIEPSGKVTICAFACHRTSFNA